MGFLRGGVGDRWRRWRREDGDEFGLGVGLEVEMWDEGGSEGLRWRRGDYEDCCEGGDLGNVLAWTIES